MPAPILPRHVGVFDSGLGGLSVLRELRSALPDTRLTYIADSAHAPYGERDPAFVAQRSALLTQALVDRGASLIVVACNTATALAIESLRAAHPGLPIVGVEPGLKPALAMSAPQHVAVMATPATLASERFRRLLQAQAGDAPVHLQPCPGLAAAIERADPEDAQLSQLLDAIARALVEVDAHTVVLGCTHYPFVAGALATRLPAHVQWVDTGAAVARRAAQLLTGTPTSATLTLLSTGDPQALQRMAQRWVDPAARADGVVI